MRGPTRSHVPNRGRENTRTFRVFLLLALVLLCGIVGHIQLVVSRRLARTILRQQVRHTIQPGPRGRIAARDGEILSETVPVYHLGVYIEQIRDPRDTRGRTLDKVQTVISRLGRRLGRDQFYSVPSRGELLDHLIRRAPMPYILWGEATSQMLATWALHRDEFPGVDVVVSYRRRYRFPDVAFHLRGLTRLSEPVVPPGSFDFGGKELVGCSGIERACDYRLRGVPGHETVTVDVFSFRHDVLDVSEPRSGGTVFLALDLAGQRLAENLFRRDRLSGALVALDLHTGEVRVLLSEPAPTFELNGEGFRKQRQRLGAAPFLDRALQAAYPPGSILKPLIALSALESSPMVADESILCTGAYMLSEGTVVHCWRREGHGALRLQDALAQSCNVYFCTLAERVGPAPIVACAQRAGLGSRPFSLLHEEESAGILFGPSWKREHGRDGRQWHRGDTANMAIGQGAWSVSPLQACVYTGCLATGRLLRPRFLRTAPPVAEVSRCGWSPANLTLVREGMRRAVDSPNGTARRAAIPGVPVCAKTGTAQTVTHGYRSTCGWTIAFAPASSPDFAVACVVEDAASGGAVAAPIVREVLRYLLRRASPRSGEGVSRHPMSVGGHQSTQTGAMPSAEAGGA